MFFDYHLRFETERQANEVLEPILSELHPSEYVRYDIGQIKGYQYNEDDLDAKPVITIVSDKWHVNLRLRDEYEALEPYQVFPKTPAHQFS